MSIKEGEQKSGFEKELQELINKHSKENGSDSPDWILSRYLVRCLEAYDYAVFQREQFYGRGPKPCDGPTPSTNTAP